MRRAGIGAFAAQRCKATGRRISSAGSQPPLRLLGASVRMNPGAAKRFGETRNRFAMFSIQASIRFGRRSA
ncbi:hypothetical protein PLANPX_1724 [Lacipirellula parvula]|uniref:Uncharacterized protein n=1 Tax=Lacipirellula parvula TaxID=2650471 RepID=A0A5K7X8A7_9BACT|nr:hypothetical protein PLANPX_1724 [Lacipirellula parvula]